MLTVTQYAFQYLNKNKKRITRQQYRTIKGQILSGDADAAVKGLHKILRCLENDKCKNSLST